jgi:NADPH-dependent ferric siderophore reductase
MKSDTTPDTARRGTRPKPRHAEVSKVDCLTPRVISVTFSGDALVDFPAPRPAAHLKLILTEPGSDWEPGGDGPRPPSRTYTARRFDADKNELDVEFVLHGDGLAANWVRSAYPGDRVMIAGPGGGYELPEGTRHIVLVADETPIPALGTVLEALPSDCEPVIFCEVEDDAEERNLCSAVSVAPTWLHRAENNSRPCSRLLDAVTSLKVPPDAAWWIACEAGAMRRMRDHLKKDRGLPPELLHHRGYWRNGQENYPDHDYGKD